MYGTIYKENIPNFVPVYFEVPVFLLFILKFYLKVVGNEKWGVKSLATDRIGYRTVVIDACKFFSGPVVFSSTYFRFLFGKLN